MSQMICTQAWALAATLFQETSHLVREEEHRDLFDLYHHAAKAGFEDFYEILDLRIRLLRGRISNN